MAIGSTVKIAFEPELVDRSKAGEVNMKMEFCAPAAKKAYWCACEIQVRSPLSLSHDVFLDKVGMRVGILSPSKKSIQKQVKLFSTPSISTNDYLVTVTTYLYDDEGAIEERHDTSEVIRCGVQNVTAKPQ
ncbi:MAG: hypothetical protein KGH94_01625 [Candidatus Micrarchaeota archaeon]|nr:hypothetical protein [Candidatus Micrarchaeota archaeon]